MPPLLLVLLLPPPELDATPITLGFQRWNPTVIGTAPTPTPTPTPTPEPNGERAFTFSNHCGYDIWVGGEGNPISPPTPCNAGCPSGTVCNTANQLCTWIVPSASNWEVGPGQSMALTLPPSWGGRFWPRTECTTANGQTTCATGDCGGNLECPVGVGGRPPATLAEFTRARGISPPAARRSSRTRTPVTTSAAAAPTRSARWIRRTRRSTARARTTSTDARAAARTA